MIILTDTEGFFEEDPSKNPNAQLISEVKVWDERYETSASGSLSGIGTGGMLTKIRAAKRMMLSGIPMVIGNGRSLKILTNICLGKAVGTYFHPAAKKMNSRKRWLAWSVKAKGEVWVDEGATRALMEFKKSLLPSGIKLIEGHWNKGDVIKVISYLGLEIAQGLSNYSSLELEKIKGLRSPDIRKLLGTNIPDEVIHRDNLVHLSHLPVIDS